MPTRTVRLDRFFASISIALYAFIAASQSAYAMYCTDFAPWFLQAFSYNLMTASLFTIVVPFIIFCLVILGLVTKKKLPLMAGLGISAVYHASMAVTNIIFFNFEGTPWPLLLFIAATSAYYYLRYSVDKF